MRNSAHLLRALCTGTKAPPAFYAWRERQAARLREALMLLTSGSESYRAADAEALHAELVHHLTHSWTAR